MVFRENPLDDIRRLEDDRARLAVLQAGRLVAGPFDPSARD